MKANIDRASSTRFVLEEAPRTGAGMMSLVVIIFLGRISLEYVQITAFPKYVLNLKESY